MSFLGDVVKGIVGGGGGGGGLGDLFKDILGSTIKDAIMDKVFKRGDRGSSGGIGSLVDFNKGPDQQEGWDDNLYKSPYPDPVTGESPAFNTAEERDAYNRQYIANYQSEAAKPAVEKVYSSEANISSLIPRMSQGGIAQFAGGGLIGGPGTVTSDSIPGMITQNGRPVEEILVGNGEVILSGKDLAAMDPDGNMKRAGMRLGGAANGTRGAEAARMYAEVARKG
jgi:hypothetical protein